MAYDKVVDSAALEQGLTKVADAIRDKTGDADALSFPDGMTGSLESLDHIKALKMAYAPFAKSRGWNSENTFKDGQTSIGRYAYYANYTTYGNPFHADMPETLLTIPTYAFAQVPGVCFRKLPDGLTTIGEGVFAYLPNLALETLPEGITSIDYSAFDCDVNLALTKLPDSLVSIGAQAFRRCCMMDIRELPPNLESIGYFAFYYCYNSIKITRIPASVKTIGTEAFRNCTGMLYSDTPGTLTFEGTPTSIGINAFSGCCLTTINVPWAEGAVANAPWGFSGTINYNYTGG